MKKFAFIALVLVWVLSLIILTVSMTDLLTNNPFKEYRMVVGISFIAITGFLIPIYKRTFRPEI